MGKIRVWLIHKLGGYAQEDWAGLINAWTKRHVVNLHPQMLRAAYSYYVHPDTDEIRRGQEKVASEALAHKIGMEMLESGLIHLTKQVDPIQDRTVKRYRMSATVLAMDPVQLPSQGGDGL